MEQIDFFCRGSVNRRSDALPETVLPLFLVSLGGKYVCITAGNLGGKVKAKTKMRRTAVNSISETTTRLSTVVCISTKSRKARPASCCLPPPLSAFSSEFRGDFCTLLFPSAAPPVPLSPRFCCVRAVRCSSLCISGSAGTGGCSPPPAAGGGLCRSPGAVRVPARVILCLLSELPCLSGRVRGVYC